MTPDFDAQMREWAERHGVTPLARDARREFSTPHGTARDEFYAGWLAYDAAVEAMPLSKRVDQQMAEIIELERWHRL